MHYLTDKDFASVLNRLYLGEEDADEFREIDA
jgi:hypothetical protein